MQSDSVSRRTFLRTLAGALGISGFALEWADIASAAHDAHQAAQASTSTASTFLSAAEAADVDAIAAQIIPTDDAPGAREAGVLFFVDRALATFFSQISAEFRNQLTDFRAAVRVRYPDSQSFAALEAEIQTEFLKSIEHTPFFTRMRLLTVAGMFASPVYGGNRDGIGWKLLGFEDQHVFTPPFGYYDRDYPGFAVDAVKSS